MPLPLTFNNLRLHKLINILQKGVVAMPAVNRLQTLTHIAVCTVFSALSVSMAACGGGGTSPPAVADTANTSATPSVTPTVSVTAAITPDRSASDVSFTQTGFAEGVSVDPATGSLYIGTGGDAAFALLRASATETSFSNWLSATGILPGAPASTSLVVGTRVQGSGANTAIYFCASSIASSRVLAYTLATQAKLADLALPAGFCNDLAFDSTGNLFVTVNNFSAATERIYKLSSSVLASGSATAASWSPWYTAPTGFDVNGLTYDAPNSRLLWADNSATRGGTKIQASATTGATATATAVISNLAVDVDGLHINNKGNLVAIDTASGAKLINLATGTAGTVTNLTDGAACSTTVAIYKADAWCSDSVGKVIRLVGAGDL
jgi:hypothetical protein